MRTYGCMNNKSQSDGTKLTLAAHALMHLDCEKKWLSQKTKERTQVYYSLLNETHLRTVFRS